MRRIAEPWNGTVQFSDRFVLFTGRSAENHLHCHGALQLVFANNCRVQHGDGREVQGTAVAIRSNVDHRLMPLADGRIYFLEPHSDLGARIDNLLPDGDVVSFDRMAKRIEALFCNENTARLDPRLAQAMGMITQAGGFAHNLSQISRRIGMSPARLRTLANEQLGMPLARWRRWSALRSACENLFCGATPTAAAADAGFSDQAHLTRTMRAMLGITPAQISAIRFS